MLRSEEFMKLPTLADMWEKWKEEGKKEGMEKGRMEERQRLAIELLKENFTDEQVAKLTKLSLEEVLELKGQLRN
ncbi:hypothetical protein [Siminovitchia sp. 179-K 8D1 HS]|uniref:hypothetical protein n=1 Tax=Siminovitchia sp. 179-K 8D1 HS TaxID=3142385 RepID=UPI0039A09B1F